MGVRGTDEVIRNFRDWSDRRPKELETYLQYHVCPMLASYAKRNRPWTDRTGNARRGLFSYTKLDSSALKLRVAHTVYYGKFLELSHAGQYAILGETLQRNRQRIATEIERFWSGG